ncbi:MAG: acyltransferase, partial [Bacilli bacterium]|nr:acyltransferase [Bacilli bacterium]
MNSSSKKKYYFGLDIIRNISCIAVLLYHMGYLKGGFLAVCTFFVLSGYLSCISAFRKEKFSFLTYYKDRIVHIYVPLLIVVFLSIFTISLIPSINWSNLKPETLSVLGGYNNYWQLSANLDYFARHVSSPFMHFWYIAILLQFDLVFPILFFIFKRLGDKIHKLVPITLTTVLTGCATAYFYYMSTK